MTLPAEGRKGKPPEWPLSEASARELALWAREWRRPQAVMWERNGQESEVAMYVRSFVEAEVPGAQVTLRNLIRQLQESLGISLPGLARNQWRIGHVSPVVAPKVARSGLKVVAGGSG